MPDIPPSTFNRDMDWNDNRVTPRRFGVGAFGIGRFGPSDPTRYAWTRLAVLAIILTLITAFAHAADTFTPGLNLVKPDVNVEDPLEPWGNKHNRNQDTLDLAICDKRTGCTIVGNLTITGVFTSSGTTVLSLEVSTFTVTAQSFILGWQFQGVLTNPEIQALSCAAGAGRCSVFSTDESDIYISTGSLAGQYKNTRTGTGP